MKVSNRSIIKILSEDNEGDMNVFGMILFPDSRAIDSDISDRPAKNLK